MRIFLAGASGVLGRRLVPLLTEAGHTVLGTTRSTAKVGLIEDLGATAAVCDVFNSDALVDLMVSFDPEVVLHELTDLPDSRDDLPQWRDANARIRIDGTRNLIRGASAVGSPRLIAQSVAWPMPPGPGAEAVSFLERSVLEYGGTVLRYGQFHGPGTFHPDAVPAEPHVHLQRAAERTVDALDSTESVIVVTD